MGAAGAGHVFAALLEAIGALPCSGCCVSSSSRIASVSLPASRAVARLAVDDPTAILGVLIAAVAAFYVLRALFLAWADWLKSQRLPARPQGGRAIVLRAISRRTICFTCGAARRRPFKRCHGPPGSPIS